MSRCARFVEEPQCYHLVVITPGKSARESEVKRLPLTNQASRYNCSLPGHMTANIV